MDTLINGRYFLHKTVNLAFFSLQLADSPNFLETRIKKKDKTEPFSKYLLQAFRNFAFKLLFYSFNFLNQPIYKFSLAIKMINIWDFKTVAPLPATWTSIEVLGTFMRCS